MGKERAPTGNPDVLPAVAGLPADAASSATPEAEAPPAPSPRRARRRRPIRWLVITAGLVVFVPFVYALGSLIGRDPALVRSPLLGKPAPEFSLPRIDAPGTLSSADLAGRLYVVNFWASWCVPCREETPVLESFYQRWRPHGVEVVGILYADDRKSALEFRRELGGTWPLVDDPDGRIALEFGVRGVPETFVIDGRGVIMAKLVGAVGPGSLDGVLEQVAEGGKPIYAQNDRYRQAP